MKKTLSKHRYGYLFIAPFFILFVIFGLYPIVYTFYLGFQKWDGISEPIYWGIKNFETLLQDKFFWTALRNTVRIWIVNFIPQMGIALLLAAIFTFNRIKGMTFFRAVFYLPNLITAASVGLLFNLFFNGDKSVVNSLLMKVGVLEEPFSFFSSPIFTSSLTSYIQMWMWFGYTLIIVMAGMTTIDRQVYEAAMVDGASKAKTFFSITLPLIRPTLIYLTITSIIGGMQLFDVPATLTDGNGNPQRSILTVAMYIYNTGFRNHNMGYASAISIGLFVIVAILSVLAFRFMKGKEESK